IGDTVDSTDHTQNLTKTYRTDILVSQTSFELVEDYFAFGAPEVGELHGEPSPIYPLIGLKEGYEELISDQGPVLVEQAALTQEAIDAQLAAR
ncbi:MAG: hypothetical protein KGJ86_09460, partial [Chloroflexota bacterium]|nr:hypothetical protein [Chloroflexota bacterium]